MPMRAPPFSASSLFMASNSLSSPTQGLQVVNQKLTTVTALAAKSSLLFTALPSKSMPSKAGNFSAVSSMVTVTPAASADTSMLLSEDTTMLASAGTLMVPVLPSMASCLALGYAASRDSTSSSMV